MNLKEILDSIPFSDLYRIAFLRNNVIGSLLQNVEGSYGLSRPELTIIVALGNQPGITAKDIARLSQQPKNTLSRAVELLLRKDVLYKIQDSNDRRRYTLYLTKYGEKSYQQILPLFQTAEKKMLSALNKKEVQQLRGILIKMCDHIIEEE